MDTIATIETENLWLEIRCRACHRATLIPAKLIPRKLARDLPVSLAAAFFRCQGCGGKDLSSNKGNPLAHAPYRAKG